MIPIIVTGHGSFATAIKETIKYVVGEQENMYFIDFNNGMGNKELEEKLRTVLCECNSKQVIFLTDLAGGTPFSTAVLLSENNPGYKVFGGCNMPMVVAAIELSEEENIEDITEEILNSAKDGAVQYGLTVSNEDVEFDDGI